MICCTYFSTSTFAVNWIFHDSILPCKRMLEIGPALVNEAFDVKFCICVGGNFRTFIFYRQTCASIFMVPWRFSVGFTALVWECFLRIWDLSEAAPDADVAREMWLFIPKDRWVEVPRRIEVENLIKTPGIRLKELQNLEGRDFRYILPCLSFPPLWRFIHSQYFCWCNSLTSFSSKLMQKMLLSSFNITWDLRRATKNKLYENMLILDGLRWVDIVWQM